MALISWGGSDVWCCSGLVERRTVKRLTWWDGLLMHPVNKMFWLLCSEQEERWHVRVGMARGQGEKLAVLAPASWRRERGEEQTQQSRYRVGSMSKDEGVNWETDLKQRRISNWEEWKHNKSKGERNSETCAWKGKVLWKKYMHERCFEFSPFFSLLHLSNTAMTADVLESC